MQNPKTVGLVRNALIAALYLVLSVVLAPIAFGPVQMRVAEALTLLPIINPYTSIGVTLGCALSNLAGAYMGVNFLGLLDVFLGSATTLVACMLTILLGKYRWRGLPILASLPPVILNAIVVGWEWGFVSGGDWKLTLYYMLLVGLGQVMSCMVMGTVLVRAMERTGADKILAMPKVQTGGACQNS